MKKNIIINKLFGNNLDHPFIVAEISGNHQQSKRKALRLIKEIKESGADAVKLQTYTPDTMTFNLKSKDFLIKNKKVYGMDIIFMIFTKRLILLGNGRRNYFSMLIRLV